MATTPPFKCPTPHPALLSERKKYILGGGAVGDKRGGQWRQMRIEIWQGKGILTLDSGEQEEKQVRTMNWGQGSRSGKMRIKWDLLILELPLVWHKSRRTIKKRKSIAFTFFFTSSCFPPSFWTNRRNELCFSILQASSRLVNLFILALSSLLVCQIVGDKIIRQ